MKQLYIIGAGGFGREVLSWARHIEKHSPKLWNIAGFLDQNANALDAFSLDVSVVSSPEAFQPTDNDLLICALGNPKLKMKLCTLMEERGGRFATLIHPTAVLGLNCTIGEGSILCPNVVLTTNVQIGRHVILNVSATVGHDAVIGDGSTLNAHCDVTGNATLGEGVLLGTHATILPRAKVGDYAVVGAGSTVLKRVQPHTTVFGVPAKKISF